MKPTEFKQADMTRPADTTVLHAYVASKPERDCERRRSRHALAVETCRACIFPVIVFYITRPGAVELRPV